MWRSKHGREYVYYVNPRITMWCDDVGARERAKAEKRRRGGKNEIRQDFLIKIVLSSSMVMSMEAKREASSQKTFHHIHNFLSSIVSTTTQWGNSTILRRAPPFFSIRCCELRMNPSTRNEEENRGKTMRQYVMSNMSESREIFTLHPINSFLSFSLHFPSTSFIYTKIPLTFCLV